MRPISYADAIRPAARSLPSIRRSLSRVLAYLQAPDPEASALCVDLLHRLDALAALLARNRQSSFRPPEARACPHCGRSVTGPSYYRHLRACGRP